MQTEVAWLKLIGIAMHEKIVIHKNGKNSDKTTKKNVSKLHSVSHETHRWFMQLFFLLHPLGQQMKI